MLSYPDYHEVYFHYKFTQLDYNLLSDLCIFKKVIKVPRTNAGQSEICREDITQALRGGVTKKPLIRLDDNSSPIIYKVKAQPFSIGDMHANAAVADIPFHHFAIRNTV